MQCPTCRLGRAKRNWKRSQWVLDTPVTGEYIQCKICSGELPEDGMGWEWVPERPMPARAAVPLRPPRPMPAFGGRHIPWRAVELVEAAVRFDTNLFGDFVCEWMMRLIKRERKLWSYDGAVQSRLGDPTHYHCPFTSENYFDPGNWIYDLALTIMCPALMAQVNWNAETKGDICESIMGAHYSWSVTIPRLNPHWLELCDARFGHHLACCSALIDYFAWHTYHLHLETGDEQMLTWVHWIVSVVSWRKHHMDVFDPAALVLPINDEVVKGPRDKSNGFLVHVITDDVD